ncbi:MAG: substrate-binding domain-containing protein [Clostridiales bacterium]|nr:substrate-binding domain-containing protein [Clostridiales bacterium]
MKKVMKRMVTAILTLCLTAVMFTGCGSGNPTDDVAADGAAESTASGSESEDMDNGGDKTIGVVFYSKTDSLGSVVYALVNEAAKTWGVNVRWEIGGLDNDTQLNSVQNLISAGVDGIVIIPLADTVTQKTAEMCEDAEVYFSLCCRDIIDEDIRKQVTANPYFAGMCYEADYDAAKEMVKIASEQGCKKASVGYNSPTVPFEKQVTAGFNDGMEEYGVDKVAEYTISDQGDANVTISNLENFLDAYPDMDLVLAGAGSQGIAEASVQLLANTGVKLATRDFFTGMEEAFENETLAVAIGGMAPDALYSLALCYNAVAGTPLSDSYVEVQQKYIFLTSAEECKVYEEYFGSDLSHVGDVYTEEYLNSLLQSNNPELNAETLQSMMDEYSMEWIEEQVQK